MNRRPNLQPIKKNDERPVIQPRNPEDVAFYKSYKWTKTSLKFRKLNPLCILCDKEGKTKKADVVDHITPIKEGGEEYNFENLQSLCHKHHNRKTADDLKRNKAF